MRKALNVAAIVGTLICVAAFMILWATHSRRTEMEIAFDYWWLYPVLAACLIGVATTQAR